MIESQNVNLRKTALEHILPRYEWYGDPEFSHYYLGKVSHNIQYKLVEDEVLLAMQSSPATGYFELAIETTDTRRYIGNTFLRKINLMDRNAEYGIFIGAKDLWGKGLGADVTRLMLDHGFQELGLHRIWLIVFAFNQRGINCFTKCGFKQEGALREAVYCNGKFHDILCMSVLATER